MKLSEKIYYCRKKSGQSQEALAEKLGVSRQAISKWETGESEPEISKLKLLAEIFSVSVDWLLSDEDPAEAAKPQSADNPHTSAAPEWLENLPGHLGRIVRRFGWLAGIVVALYGLGITAVGFLARFTFNRMFADVLVLEGSELLSRQPFYILSGFMFILGLVVIAAGLILALVLKKKFK